MPLDSDDHSEEAPDPIEDQHHAIFEFDGSARRQTDLKSIIQISINQYWGMLET